MQFQLFIIAQLQYRVTVDIPVLKQFHRPDIGPVNMIRKLCGQEEGPAKQAKNYFFHERVVL
jgi:hypothetical protein